MKYIRPGMRGSGVAAGHCPRQPQLACFSDRQPGDWGPRRVRQDELRTAFGDGWNIASITASTFAINPGPGPSSCTCPPTSRMS
jgi:hypothetical protein